MTLQEETDYLRKKIILLERENLVLKSIIYNNEHAHKSVKEIYDEGPCHSTLAAFLSLGGLDGIYKTAKEIVEIEEKTAKLEKSTKESLNFHNNRIETIHSILHERLNRIEKKLEHL